MLCERFQHAVTSDSTLSWTTQSHRRLGHVHCTHSHPKKENALLVAAAPGGETLKYIEEKVRKGESFLLKST